MAIGGVATSPVSNVPSGYRWKHNASPKAFQNQNTKRLSVRFSLRNSSSEQVSGMSLFGSSSNEKRQRPDLRQVNKISIHAMLAHLTTALSCLEEGNAHAHDWEHIERFSAQAGMTKEIDAAREAARQKLVDLWTLLSKLR